MIKPSKKGLLFSRKEAKDFHSPAMARMHPGPGRRTKVFWFFFSKKNFFLSLP
jgi:hypothetical protein